MKKLTFLVSALLMTMVSAAYCATPISSEDDLKNIRYDLNDDYYLTTNISVTGVWTPLGNDTARFTGTLDGKGYAISGLDNTSAAENVGLFGYTDGATIKDLRVSGSFGPEACNTATAMVKNVGVLVGQAKNTTIDNVEVSGSVCGASSVGGLVGAAVNGGSITNASSYVAVSAYKSGTTGDLIGGLVGYSEAVISHSLAESTIAAPPSKVVGGLVGQTTTNVFSCYFKGEINATGQVGGLVGKSEGKVYDSYADTKVIQANLSEDNPMTRALTATGKSAGVVAALSGDNARVYNTYSVSERIQGYEAGGIASSIDGYVADITKTVYCNAAMVDELRAIKNTSKPGNAVLFAVFNNIDSASPIYGQSNWATTPLYTEVAPYGDTVIRADTYSKGDLNAATASAAFSLMAGASGCGFNANNAWNLTTTPPKLNNVGYLPSGMGF